MCLLLLFNCTGMDCMCTRTQCRRYVHLSTYVRHMREPCLLRFLFTHERLRNVASSPRRHLPTPTHHLDHHHYHCRRRHLCAPATPVPALSLSLSHSTHTLSLSVCVSLSARPFAPPSHVPVHLLPIPVIPTVATPSTIPVPVPYHYHDPYPP